MRNGYTSIIGAVLVGVTSLLAPVDPAAAQRADTTRAAFMPLLRIAGEVHIDSLRVLRPGIVRVRFFGDVSDTLSWAVVEGVPEPVEPGRLYRDVRVYFEVVSGLEDIDAIVEEALRSRAAASDTARGRPLPRKE